jgi:hypothetical protein
MSASCTSGMAFMMPPLSSSSSVFPWPMSPRKFGGITGSGLESVGADNKCEHEEKVLRNTRIRVTRVAGGLLHKKDTTRRRRGEIQRLEAELIEKLSLASRLEVDNKALVMKERLLNIQVKRSSKPLCVCACVCV